MTVKMFRSAVLGGLVVFVWMMVSWMLLPWHRDAIHKFKDEKRVAEIFREYAPASGTYMLPYSHCDMGCKSNEEALKGMERSKEMMEKGPVVFATVQAHGMTKRPATTLLFGLLIQMLGALGITYVISNMKAMNFQKKVAHVTLMGLLVGLLGILPAWNWGAQAGASAFPMFCDYIIGWFFAGLVIAKFTK